MPKTTHFFDTVSSPLKIAEEPKYKNKCANLPQDFDRLQQIEKVSLNGKPFRSYVGKYNHFATEQDVEDFFTEEIFKKLQLPDSKKEEVITYLKTYFSQQGFMFPVLNTITFTLTNTGKAVAPPLGPIGMTINELQDQHINISVDEDGLTVQEYIKARDLKIRASRSERLWSPDDPATRDYVIMAEGTVHFDFKANAADPKISVKSNKISLGCNNLNVVLGPRADILTQIWDWIASVLGFNKVELLAPDTKEGSEPSSGVSGGGSFQP